MSLEDRTNETIHCVMPYASSLYVDLDSDSSVWPEPWAIIDPIDDDEAPAIRLTMAEAGLLHDRLGLMLGRVSIPRAYVHIPFGPEGVDANEADADYLRSAAVKWGGSRLSGYNVTKTIEGILNHLADKLHPIPDEAEPFQVGDLVRLDGMAWGTANGENWIDLRVTITRVDEGGTAFFERSGIEWGVRHERNARWRGTLKHRPKRVTDSEKVAALRGVIRAAISEQTDTASRLGLARDEGKAFTTPAQDRLVDLLTSTDALSVLSELVDAS